MRSLQDRFDTRRLADRLDEKLGRTAFTDEDREFIESRRLFFLATADARGPARLLLQGRRAGVRPGDRAGELAFPSYDGNGMFRSLGNVLANPTVGAAVHRLRAPNRLRVNGRASMPRTIRWFATSRARSSSCVCAPRRIFPNCPRYIHRMQIVELSPYAPCEGKTPPDAGVEDLPPVQGSAAARNENRALTPISR